MKTTTNDKNRILEKLIPEKYEPMEDDIYSCLENPDETSYDRHAKVYEFVVSSFFYNKIVWGTTPGNYKEFARHAAENCIGLILDIGCGGLSATAEAYSQIQNPLILMDRSLEMLKFGKKRLLKKSAAISPNIVFLQGDALDLPFPKNSIDNIINFGMLHLFDNKEEYLKKILGELKKGGQFFFTSITNDRPFSKLFIRFLQRKGELGKSMNSDEIVALFKGKVKQLEHYTIGSFVFISGVK